MYTVLASAPAAEPISTADAKEHLRVTVSDDDSYIDDLVIAARKNLEGILDRKLITQTWDLYLDRWPAGDSIVLPFGSLQSVTSVKFYDRDDTEYTLSSSVYRVATWEVNGRVVLKDAQNWPSTTLRNVGGVVVRFVCGYGDAGSDVPEPLIHAMKLTIGHYYENRESVIIAQGLTPVEVPDAAKALAYPYRIARA